MSPLPASNTAAAATGYFVDQKKGEVNELKQLLKNINVERDPKRKREIIKKVIAYMTLGIDVSRLFTDMIMAIETKDIVVKKMVYLYLCNYAHKEPDMAIMCINTLRRDCDNEDPMVRGLALRSLSSLRMESIMEYIQQPIQKALVDISPYVRKNGIMAILKLRYLSVSLIETNGYVSQLYRMLEDVDSNVVTNVIYVLNELQMAEGGMNISQTTILNLLNRISEFSEWGLNTILDLVARYNPASEEETFAIMNLLDPVLRTANSGAVLATFKCFMKLSITFPEMQPQIIARSKPPLLTLITGGQPEIQYTLLKHLQIILPRKAAAGIFDEEYRQFYVRYNEPPYVKYLKVDVLPLIANESNARDIASELGEYVTDVDSELSKRAIAAIAEIGMKVTCVAGEMANALISLVEMDMPYIRAEAVKYAVDLLRIFPPAKDYILPSISRCFKRIEDNDARAALVWVLGEYGQEITEAPYMLEPLIDNYEEENSLTVKLQLLSASMKLFFKRPPEMHAMLGRLLRAAMNDGNNQDVHDRALMYYRVLSTDINVAATLFVGLDQRSMMAGSSAGGKGYAELRDDEKAGQIFSEINTLSVIFDKPSVKFIQDEYQLKYVPSFIPDGVTEESLIPATITVQTPLIPSVVTASPSPSVSVPTYTTAAPTPTPTYSSPSPSSGSLLDFGDDFLSSPPQQVTAAAVIVPTLVLNVNPQLSPQKFQQLWLSLSDSFNGKLCNVNRVPDNTQHLEGALRQNKVVTMASGPLPPSPSTGPGLKFFLFAAEPDDLLTNSEGGLFLAQMILMNSTGEVTANIKSTSNQPDAIKLFIEILKKALSS